jgi:ABC-type branched-subunit amino acid transport system ATPase component/ABC-type branched-subunit amino acid transport system permease subunit
VGVFALLPRGLPLGIAGLGAVDGAILALHAMGIVLLYTRTRVLSFAQFGLGAVAAVFFYLWVLYNQWAVVAHGVCHCVAPHRVSMSFLQHNPDVLRAYLLDHHAWILAVNALISAGLAVLMAADTARRRVYPAIVGVFARAPRIVPTVATLAFAVALGASAGLASLRTTSVFGHRIFSWWPYGPRPGTGINGRPALPEGTFVTPFHSAWGFTLGGGARFHIYDIFAVVLSIGALVYLWFRFTRGRRGLLSRATAANLERAATLGVDVARETRDPWIIAGAMSGLAGALAIAQSSSAPPAALDMAGLTLVLAAVVLARLSSPGWALVTSVLLGVLDQAMFWNFHSHVQFQASLVVIIGVALVLQRDRGSRADRDAESVFTSAAEPRPVPQALRNTPGVHGMLRGTAVVVAILFVSYPLLANPRQLSLGIVVVAYMVAGLSLLVLAGWAGQVSVGQLALSAVGAYVVAVSAVSWHFPMPLALVAGAVAGALVAPAVGLPALRLPGPFVAIMTLALAIAVPAVLLSPQLLGDALPNSLPRPELLGLDLSSDRYLFWFSLLVLLGALAIVTGLRRSRLRRALIAARDNPQAAAAFGLDVMRVRLVAFSASGLLAGLGGGLLAYANGGVRADSFSALNSVVLFLLVVIGGLSAVSGPVLGAAAYGLLQSAGAAWIGLLNGLGTIVVLAFRPSGLAGMVTGLRDAAIRVVMHLQGHDLLRLRGSDGASRIPVADRGAQAPVVPVQYRVLGEGYGPVEGTRLRAVAGVDSTEGVATTALAEQVDDAVAAISCHRLDVAYGGAVAVSGLSLRVAPGEVLAIVGLNGAGKTSLLRALAGLEPAAHGTVELRGEDVTRLLPHQRAERGVAFIPGGEAVLPTLTVRENLAVTGAGGDAIAAVLEQFPVLGDRVDTAAGDLSGGEQHLLALGQALLLEPAALLIDELSLGLSASALAVVLDAVIGLVRSGCAVVLVEQSISSAMEIADSALFLESGRVRYQGPAAALREHPELFASVAFGAAGTPIGAGSELARTRHINLAERDPALVVSDIAAGYGPIQVVDGVSLEVQAGEVVGLLGPNGAGKTSLFDCLSGTLALRRGTVTLHGHDITTLAPYKRAELGLMRSFQSVRLFPSLTVRDCIAVALETRLAVKSAVMAGLWLRPARAEERRVDERVDALLELLRLESVADAQIGSLSLGSRRMVDLACQLAARPKVLLLDEPASGLAHAETELLGPLVGRISADLDCAVLIIEHNIAVLASVAHRLVAMRDGVVIAHGVPADVLNDPAVRAAYFGASRTDLARTT